MVSNTAGFIIRLMDNLLVSNISNSQLQLVCQKKGGYDWHSLEKHNCKYLGWGGVAFYDSHYEF